MLGELVASSLSVAKGLMPLVQLIVLQVRGNSFAFYQ